MGNGLNELPPGFTLDKKPGAELPPGFTLDQPAQEGVVKDVAKEVGKAAVRGVSRAAGDVGEAIAGPFGPGKHFQNLMADIGLAERPKVEQPYGEQIIQAAGVQPTPKTRAGLYAGSIAEPVFNPESYLGPGGLLVKGGSAALSGLGGEVGGEFFGTPGAVAGSILAGPAAAAASAERNLSKIASLIPGREANYDAAKQIYKSLEQSNVRIAPQGMDDLVRQIKTDLNKEGFRAFAGAPGAPVFQVVDELATSGGSIQGIDAVRKVLNRYKTDPANRFAADHAIDSIDDYLMHVDPKHVISGNPAEDAQALKHAQSLWATHKQLETIEEGSIRGQRRAGVSGSGANRINTARQEINKILNSDKKSRGMSQEAKDKMSEIVLGTWLTNKARGASKFAPTGPVSVLAPMAAMATTGSADVGLAMSGSGFIAKHLGEYLTDKQIRELQQLIQSESPLGAGVARTMAPRIAEQKAVPAAALTRAAITSPLDTGAGSGL